MEQKTIVWIRSAGRCAICKRYLLDEALGDVVPVGENAHIVGEKDTDRSPRGRGPLPVEERNKAENLALLCREQHKLIDSKIGQLVFTVDELLRVKRKHEAQMRRLTALADEGKTTTLTVLGTVRGNSTDLSRMSIATAVVASGRFPHYPPSFHGDGLKVDLQAIPDEGSKGYYATSRSLIDGAIAKLDEGVRDGQIEHISVFAFARLPVLIYLGFKLDDTWALELYQRHRTTQGWAWQSDPSNATRYARDSEGDLGREDHVLLLDVSGSIPNAELPMSQQGWPVHRIRPEHGAPGPDTLLAQESLAKFEEAVRDFLSWVEQSVPCAQRLHVHGALPVTAAIAFGRAIGPHDPAMTFYEKGEDGLRASVLELCK